MKKILLIALLALSASLSAQWETHENKNDWGEVIGTYQSITIKNGKTGMVIRDNITDMGFAVLGESFCTKWIKLSIKKANGKVFESVLLNSIDHPYQADFKYCGKAAFVRDYKADKKRRLIKKGTVIMYDELKKLSFGDKILVKTDDETYIFNLE